MSNIRKSKNHEDMPDFDEMWGDVQEEIQEKDAEDAVVNRASELKQLSIDIDKATTAVINAKLSLESSIRQAQREEGELGAAVNTISEKVGTINTHIDNVLKDAPTKLNVAVHVSDTDKQRLQELFDKEHQWMITQMQQHLRQVNDMLINEQRRAQKRYKEYDGCYLGHYVQWFFWFFFVLGFFVFTSVIIMIVGKSLNWF